MIVVVLVLLVLVFVVFDPPFKSWLFISAAVLLLGMISGITNGLLSALFAILFIMLALLLYFFPGLRRKLVTFPVFRLIKGRLPSVSETEREAIQAGTVWWDAELFSGDPDWDVLFSGNSGELSDKEREFIEGPVVELCNMVDDWQVTHELNDLPKPVWDYIKSRGFFALNTSPKYGGLGFSAFAQSRIIQLLSTRSSTLAVTVMVPNSLGPAELIQHYGTDRQKQEYLPRLASGEEVPCFGLTNPWAGSDAAGMPDCGVVCRRKVAGELVTGFTVNWEKRYITLGPVATLLGLAFRAYDPQRILGEQFDLGITCALVPTATSGIEIGRRHLPLNAAFQNGPNIGKDVFVPLDWIIGGEQMVGKGWRMLMESLAAGRGISLPAAAAGSAKLMVRTCGAYARVREQFGLEIGRFEGIEEALARIGGLSYLLDSGRSLLTGALDAGERPSVISAIVKQQCTDLSRQVVNDAMELHGGKGICMGPANYLARMYQQIPISITVEGANILTRSLIIYGQGALRCHPYLLREIEAASNEDEVQGLEAFDAILPAHIEHIAANKMRSLVYGASRGRLARGSGSGPVLRHTRSVAHLSASFAWLSDVTLLILGGDLKRKEMLSGRFADVLSNLYLVSAALKQFQDSGNRDEVEPVADWACHWGLYRAQQALDGILRNYPSPWLGRILRITVFPAGRYLYPPGDDLSRKVATVLQTPGQARDELTEDVFIPLGEGEIINQLERAFVNMVQLEYLHKKVRKSEIQEDMGNFEQKLEKLVASGEITGEESAQLLENRKLVRAVIDVDSFEAGSPVA